VARHIQGGDVQNVSDVSVLSDRQRSWVKRIGTLAFGFFLAKGVAWLVVAALLWLGWMG